MVMKLKIIYSQHLGSDGLLQMHGTVVPGTKLKVFPSKLFSGKRFKLINVVASERSKVDIRSRHDFSLAKSNFLSL